MTYTLQTGKTDLNLILKGNIDKSVVVLSTIKFNCLDYDKECFKEFDLTNFSLKKFQILDIKGFKRFLRMKDIKEFKDIVGTTENLSFNGLTFKKEIGRNMDFIAIYFNNERILSLNQEYLKPIFRELKNIEILNIFLNYQIPAYFEINKDGFLIAPSIREDD